MNKIILGSEELLSLRSLKITIINDLVDSGAKTSALHAVNISTFLRDESLWVKFDVNPIQNDFKTVISCESKVIDKRVVKSSSGFREQRFVIQSELALSSGESWKVELTLTNRDSMGYRMLLGREAMIGKAIVDPEKSFMFGEPSKAHLKDTYKTNQRHATGYKIGLLASNPDLYSNRRIIEAGETRGHEMIFLNIKECYMKLDGSKPEIHYRGGKILKDLDAVIPRIRPSITYYGCALTRQFEALNIFSLNGSSAITKSRDKLYSLQAFLHAGVPIPTTGFANSPLDTDDLIKMVGGAPLIIKLLEGTQGKGVVLAETKKAAESVINAFKSLRANILLQEFIK
jgi:ribosomal protein S6--L-glutamate ligase